MAYASFNLLADNVKCTFKVLNVGNSGYEQLLNVGLRLQCIFAQTAGVGGHISQMHQGEACALYFLDYHTKNCRLLFLVFRKEHQSCAVFPFLRYRDALQQNKLVGNLKHDAGTVAGLVVGSFSSAVAHVFKHLQRRINQLVRFVSVDVNHHANTTGIVFVRCIV